MSVTEGIINIVAAVGSAYEAIGTLSGFVKGFGKSWKEGWNTKVVEEFSKSVADHVDQIGNGFQKLPDHVKSFTGSLKSLPTKAQSAFKSISKSVSSMGDNIKTSFSNLKRSYQKISASRGLWRRSSSFHRR